MFVALVAVPATRDAAVPVSPVPAPINEGAVTGPAAVTPPVEFVEGTVPVAVRPVSSKNVLFPPGYKGSRIFGPQICPM